MRVIIVIIFLFNSCGTTKLSKDIKSRVYFGTYDYRQCIGKGDAHEETIYQALFGSFQLSDHLITKKMLNELNNDISYNPESNYIKKARNNLLPERLNIKTSKQKRIRVYEYASGKQVLANVFLAWFSTITLKTLIIEMCHERDNKQIINKKPKVKISSDVKDLKKIFLKSSHNSEYLLRTMIKEIRGKYKRYTLKKNGEKVEGFLFEATGSKVKLLKYNLKVKEYDINELEINKGSIPKK